jgi:hypothetical protein
LAEKVLNGVVESAKFVVPFQGTESDCPVPQGGASLALGYRIWNPFRILSRLNLPVFCFGYPGTGYSNFSEPSLNFGR